MMVKKSFIEWLNLADPNPEDEGRSEFLKLIPATKRNGVDKITYVEFMSIMLPYLYEFYTHLEFCKFENQSEAVLDKIHEGRRKLNKLRKL